MLEGVTFTPCNSTANINQRRELRLWAAQNNPALLADAALFANIDEFRSDSTANYHGLLLSGRGSIGGVNLDANYTLSRCMSDRVAPGIPNPNETFHRGRDRSYCQSDRRHYFNLAVVANAPQFEQSRVERRGVELAILGALPRQLRRSAHHHAPASIARCRAWGARRPTRCSTTSTRISPAA